MDTKNSQTTHGVSRRRALQMIGAASLAGMCGLGGLQKAFAAKKKPNIIFILTDDHRYDAMSCMNHPFIKTPNLDRLANEGVLFSNSFVTTSLCSPSRASFLTGNYAHTHGITTNHTPWDNDNVTFLEILKKAGYDTAFIGKWHMPGDNLPKLRGLDRFITITKEGGQGVYFDCPLVIDGVDTPRPGKYITEDLTDFAIDFVGQKRDNPFCLYLSHKAVHFGFRPPKHLDNLYDGVDLKLPPESDTWNTYTNNNIFVGAPLPMNWLYRNYCETVVSVDEQVGRLLAKLEQMGVLDDTIIIYAGDNGHFWGEHGMYDKRWAYEESIRVPLMIRYPKMTTQPGARPKQMVLNIDVAPTILELAGVASPVAMQGQSAAPLMAEENAPGRHSWLYEHFPVFPIPIPGMTAVRTDRYKYIEYQDDLKPAELFDLQEDPKEMHNIINTAQGQSVLPQLRRELQKIKQDTGYRFFTRAEQRSIGKGE